MSRTDKNFVKPNKSIFDLLELCSHFVLNIDWFQKSKQIGVKIHLVLNQTRRDA